MDFELVDKGKLIEAGWESFKSTLPPDFSQSQFDAMRLAFFSGAQHVFTSTLEILSEEDDLTGDDMKRINLIHQELGEFIDMFRLKHGFVRRQ